MEEGTVGACLVGALCQPLANSLTLSWLNLAINDDGSEVDDSDGRDHARQSPYRFEAHNLWTALKSGCVLPSRPSWVIGRDHKKSGTGHRDAVTFTPFEQFRIKTMGWGRASAPTAWHGLRPSGFGIGGTTGRPATRGRIKQ